MTDHLLRVTKLEKHFPLRKGVFRRKVGEVQAVSGIDMTIRSGETVALVGESGCGKSTTARLLMAAFPPSSGAITLHRDDGPLSVHALRGAARRQLWRDVQLIFQDPYTSLNPRMTVRQILAEPLRNFGIATGATADDRIADMLEQVGLGASAMNRYPHAFSGGQRQRIGIARALVVGPRLVIGDEPVSALDVSVGAQIINLFADLKTRLGLTYLLITHDLSLVRHSSDRALVMYQGRIVEEAPAEVLFQEPKHPYTQALLAAAPKLRTHKQPPRIPPDIPPSTQVPQERGSSNGCVYAQRCPVATDICRITPPPRVLLPSDRAVACHSVSAHNQTSPATCL